MNNPQWAQAAQQLLVDTILSFWSSHMVDHQQGGFYGRMRGDNTLDTSAEKGAVLNARILWSFSAAYRILHDPTYLTLAQRAKNYIYQHFLDTTYGGVYWALNAQGQPLDTKKQTYAIAFTIYGLAEYVRATNDQQALQTALQLFHELEAHAYDPAHQGYLEALTRQWLPLDDMRLSDKDQNDVFTMNTHLHVLEAYTTLLRVYPDKHVQLALTRLVHIFATRFYNPTNGHFDLFFDIDWHSPRNIASYGHDIEASWLLTEALDVLNMPELTNDLMPIIAHSAEASREGIQPDGSMIHETDDAQRQWWVMCEQTIGFLNRYQQSHNTTYLTIAQQAFEYILTHLVDHQHGEMYWAILPDGSVDTTNDKAGFWKCPYHNARMCLELLSRLSHLPSF